jgi:hypothetical protein
MPQPINTNTLHTIEGFDSEGHSFPRNVTNHKDNTILYNWRVSQITLEALLVEYIVTYTVLAWLIIMGSGLGDWIYWHFFTITVNYNSHTFNSFWMPHDSCLTNLYEESLKGPWLSLSLKLLPTVSRPVSLGIKLTTRFSILSDSCGVCWCGALSLTRGRICRLQLLLALASEVILRSEYRGTRNHILLSQILDFPFRRLLRLARLRWRYSTPPPDGTSLTDWNQLLLVTQP